MKPIKICIARLLFTFAIVTPSIVLAADDAVIENLQSDVTTTRGKADKNTQAIESLMGGLPAERAERIAADADLQNQINAIQQIPGPQGPAGLTGPQGPQGIPGPAGADAASCSVARVTNGALISCPDGSNANVNDGASASSGQQGVRSFLLYFEVASAPQQIFEQNAIDPPMVGSKILNCPNGTTIAGGSYVSNNSYLQIVSSKPNFATNGWQVDYRYSGMVAVSLELRAVCAAYIPTGQSLNDSDQDGVPDYIDNCPAIANPLQVDSDSNGIGDACEPVLDSDGDGIVNTVDNCPTVPNPNQLDTDADGIGDVCDPTPQGPQCILGMVQTQPCSGTPPAGMQLCEQGVQTRYCMSDGTWPVYGSCVGAIYASVCP